MANETIRFVASDSQEINIAVGTDYILKSISGTSQVGVAFEMEKGYLQDGRFYLNSNIDVRILNINIAITADTYSNLVAKRRTLQKVFNPKLGLGTLYYTLNGYQYKLICGVSTAVTVSNKHDNDEEISVILTAPNPYWTDITAEELELADYVGGLTFPVQFPTIFAERAQQGTVNNIGDVETPVIITFNGPAVNPKIELLETGEFVEVTTTLTATQQLIINTAYDENTVTFVDGSTEESAFNLINNDSTFFQLPAGESTLSFSTTDPADDPTVSISYYNRYIGA